VKRPERFVAAARAAGYLPVVAGATGVRDALCLGSVDRMEDLYAACDVVVCSSRREGTPYALLEGMAAGRPVVAPPVGDIPWLVGDAGVVTEDLAGALSDLAGADAPDRLGVRAKRRVRERFPAGAVAPRLRALYATLLA
jgi:glycosyltransferase involved in cell wall biosynthesis